MIDLAVAPAFIGAVLLILIAPGPDMMFMIGTGVQLGRRAAIVAAFGVTAGVSVYVFGSAFGLAALIERVPEVLDAIRLLGAAYLGYLAVTTWRGAGAPQAVGPTEPMTNRQIFRRGFIVNVTNPKVALFIAAFIPQFVDPALGHTTVQFLIFAMAFQLLGLIVDVVVGVSAGSVKQLLTDRPQVAVRLERIAALVYLTIALWLVFEVARAALSG